MDISASQPDRFFAFFHEAKKLFSENRLPEAVTAFQAALSEKPDDERVFHHLGVLYRKTGQLEKAIVHYQEALFRNPDHPEFLNNLAALKIDVGDHAAARPLLEKSLSLNPNSLDALYNMGLVRQKSGDMEGAQDLFERLIQKNPRSAQAYHNLGAVQIKRGDLKAAEDCFRKALEINPEYEKVRVDQALILLLRGQLKEGFELYEHRYRLGNGRMEKRLSPLWDGHPIHGKTLLVAFEQGLGDSIQFARYLSLAKEKCKKLIFQCQKPLHSIIAGNNAEIFVRETVKRSEFDVGISLLSLPRLLGTDCPEQIPAFSPYLSIPSDRMETWKKKISQQTWNIGIVWAGNAQHQNDWNRSLHLKDFSIFTDIPDVQFHGLQIGHRATEALSPPIGMNFANWGPQIRDFSDTAAIIHQLDLVISVDTSVAHLSGAIGKPTWLLLPYIPDWRWMLAGETTPWYPSMRLYRQPSLGDWESVFLKLKSDFANIFRKPDENVAEVYTSKSAPEKVAADIEEAPKISEKHDRTEKEPTPAKKNPIRESRNISPEAFRLFQKAMARRAAGRFSEAETALRKCMELDWNSSEIRIAMGVTCLEKGVPEEAVTHFDEALKIAPDHAEALLGLGNCHRELSRYQAARSAYQTVLDLRSDHIEALRGMALTFRDEFRWKEALRYYQKASELKPGNAELMLSIGNLKKAMGDSEGAENAYREVLEREPNNPRAHLFLGLLLLLDGNFQDGWKEYEWRWKTEPLKTRHTELPGSPWEGKPLGGRTLLVHSEQGFGDSIQFSRFLARIPKENGRIVLQCERELQNLFATIPQIDQLVEKGATLPPIDTHSSLIQLGRILSPDRASIPAQIPYLRAPEDRIEKWRETLAKLPDSEKLQVGLVWAGNPTHKKDRERSVPLSTFSPLFELPGFVFHSLQVGRASAEIISNGFSPKVIDHSQELHNFGDTAGAIHHLDFVLTVDTAVAHLAAAMGKTVWILLPFSPDWRWRRERRDSPWYPTIRLFRQPAPGEWNPIIQELKAELTNLPDVPYRFIKPTSTSPPPSTLAHKPNRPWRKVPADAISFGGKDFFFVTGIPRSGTTWLQMLLDAHPELRCRPEDFFSFFKNRIPELLDQYNQRLSNFQRRTNKQQPLHRLEKNDGQAIFRFLIGHILNKGFSDPSALRSGANDNEIIHHFQLYNALFPASRFVVILRDPRDVTVSSWFINRQTSSDFSKKYQSLPLWAAHIRRGWVAHVRRVQQACQMAGNRLMTLRYEDLRQDTSQCFSTLLNFLEVQNDEQIRTECIEKTRFSRLTGGRKAGVENSADFFRKGIVGDWKNHLDEGTQAAFLQEAGPEMEWLQYR